MILPKNERKPATQTNHRSSCQQRKY